MCGFCLGIVVSVRGNFQFGFSGACEIEISTRGLSCFLDKTPPAARRGSGGVLRLDFPDDAHEEARPDVQGGAVRHVSENPGDLPSRPLTAADGAHQQPEGPVDANPETAGGKTRGRVVRQQHGARVTHRDLDRSRFADMQCEQSDKGAEFGRWRCTGGSGVPSRLRPVEGSGR